MKVLFLAPRFVLPADTGGKIRTYNLIKQIVKIADVHLACFSFDEPEDSAHVSEMEKMGSTVTLIPAPGISFFKKTSMAMQAMPFSVAKYRSAELARAITMLVDK